MPQNTHSMVEWLEAAIKGFLDDPPDTPFQEGFLAACINCYTDCRADIPDWMLPLLKEISNG